MTPNLTRRQVKMKTQTPLQFAPLPLLRVTSEKARYALEVWAGRRRSKRSRSYEKAAGTYSWAGCPPWPKWMRTADDTPKIDA